ncbi:glycosyl hydrolase family 28-related protein [Flavitalea flava]
MPSSYVSAQASGIALGGTIDQAPAINALLLNPSYTGLILDVGGAVYISTTVNANGKTILYYSGNYFTGAGTIDNHIIDAGYRQKLFDITITLTNCKIAGEMFSVLWYGARGDDSGDDQPVIQKTIDTVIANQNKIKTIFFPQGSYLIFSPIILYKSIGVRRSAIYQQVSIRLQGETDFSQSGNGSRIYTNFRDTFAIGIQQGENCEIANLNILGKFEPPAVTGPVEYSWYSLTLDQFTDGVSRDNRYSPYSGIVIDPFTNGQDLPLPGGMANAYPGFTDWYSGDRGSNNGSTAISIKNCMIFNFVVGICSSPNPFTSNAEFTAIEKVRFGNCKVAISGGQPQEKSCKFYDIMCWSNTHTVFATGLYGARTPGNWFCELVNLAGNVNQFVYNNGAGYFPSHFEKIYAEKLGKIGFIGSNLQSSICNGVINFAIPETESGLYDYHIDGFNTLFFNCMLRMYNTGLPVSIKGRHYFQNCSFEATPYCPSELVSNQNQYGISVFTNCIVGAVNLGMQQEMFIQPTFFEGELIYGKVKTTDVVQYGSGRWETLEIDGGQSPTLEYWATVYNNTGQFQINIDANRNAVVTVGAIHINKFQLGNIVVEKDNGIVGIVGTINFTTNQITINYIPPGIVSGNSYVLACVYPKAYFGAFLGDITANSTSITNVVFDKYGVDTTRIVGTLIEFPFIVNFAFTGYYQNIAKIIAYNSGTRTITLDQAPNLSQKGAYLSLGEVKKTLKGSPGASVNAFPSNTLLTIRSEIFVSEIPGIEKRYLVTREGFLNAAAIGGGETRQAQWNEVDPTIKSSGTTNFSLVAPAGYLLQGFVVKSTTAFTLTAGTTVGGTDISAGLILAANVSNIIPYLKFCDTAFTAYFSGITGSGGTTTITAILNAI